MRHGQGLLETTIAIAILTTGVVAALSLSASNVSLTQQATSRFIAANLAREGIEVVRNIRDTNWLAGGAYDVGLPSTADFSFAPVFDQATGAWTLAYGPDCIGVPACEVGTQVYIQNNQYIQTGTAAQVGQKTIFQRIMYVFRICRDASGNEVNQTSACSGSDTETGKYVSANVQWKDQRGAQFFSIQEKLYNWK